MQYIYHTYTCICVFMYVYLYVKLMHVFGVVQVLLYMYSMSYNRCVCNLNHSNEGRTPYCLLGSMD